MCFRACFPLKEVIEKASQNAKQIPHHMIAWFVIFWCDKGSDCMLISDLYVTSSLVKVFRYIVTLIYYHFRKILRKVVTQIPFWRTLLFVGFFSGWFFLRNKQLSSYLVWQRVPEVCGAHRQVLPRPQVAPFSQGGSHRGWPQVGPVALAGHSHSWGPTQTPPFWHPRPQVTRHGQRCG